MIFLKYTNLPGIIGERLYATADKDKDGFLNFIEFMTPIMKINSSDVLIKMRLIFDLYDFDEDNLLMVDDIKTLLMHTIEEPKFSIFHHKSAFSSSNPAVLYNPLQGQRKY